MNTKIKIGEPHLYFKLRKAYNKYANDAENVMTFIVILATLIVGFLAWLKMDLTSQLAVTTLVFFGTTIIFLMLFLGRRK